MCLDGSGTMYGLGINCNWRIITCVIARRAVVEYLHVKLLSVQILTPVLNKSYKTGSSKVETDFVD